MLDRERFGIERQYMELDDAILHGQGSARILQAAQLLVQAMVQHFTHEEQFRRQISFPVFDDPRVVWKNNMSELLQIEAGLRQEEVYAALRLRSFCKGWIHLQKMWTSIFQPSVAAESETAHI
jgi:hemerythrin